MVHCTSPLVPWRLMRRHTIVDSGGKWHGSRRSNYCHNYNGNSLLTGMLRLCPFSLTSCNIHLLPSPPGVLTAQFQIPFHCCRNELPVLCVVLYCGLTYQPPINSRCCCLSGRVVPNFDWPTKRDRQTETLSVGCLPDGCTVQF